MLLTNGCGSDPRRGPVGAPAPWRLLRLPGAAGALGEVETSKARRRPKTTAGSLERTRPQARISLVAGLGDGMSISDIGRGWEFSRQLAARYAKEALGEAGSGT